jgi:hypothetical protein
MRFSLYSDRVRHGESPGRDQRRIATPFTDWGVSSCQNAVYHVGESGVPTARQRAVSTARFPFGLHQFVFSQNWTAATHTSDFGAILDVER